MIAITASTPIHGAYFFAPSGRIGNAMRMNPYVPIFSMTPASSTEPIVGASVWASGSHVWNGHIGTLTAKPSAIAAEHDQLEGVAEAAGHAERLEQPSMSNVCAPVPSDR